jgi:hypothetical protein
MDNEFEQDLRDALGREARRPRLELDAGRLRAKLRADEQRRRTRRQFELLGGVGAAVVAVVAIALWPSFQRAPSASEATQSPCVESTPTTHGGWWVEIGGPHAYFNVKPGTLYASDNPWKIIVRFDPDAAEGESVATSAEAVPSGERVEGTLNSRMDPSSIYRFASPAPELSGGWYLFEQHIPKAGCWRLSASIDGRIVGTAVLSVVHGAPSPVASGPPSAPTPAMASPVAPTSSSSTEPAAWLPPWAGPATPAEVVSRSVLPFCGVEDGGFAGLPDAQVRACFVTAIRDGRAAEFVSIRSTIEGDPIATITRTLPGGGLEVFIDSTQDAFGASVWTRTICRGSVEDQEFGFAPEGCDQAVVIR